MPLFKDPSHHPIVWSSGRIQRLGCIHIGRMNPCVAWHEMKVLVTYPVALLVDKNGACGDRVDIPWNTVFEPFQQVRSMLFSRSATVSTSLGDMCSWLGKGVLWWTWHKRNWEVQEFEKRNDPSKWQGGLNTWPVMIIQLFVFHHIILKQKQWISAASIFFFLGFWCSFEACTHSFAKPLSLFSTGWNFKDPGESVCSWIFLLHFATGYGNQNQANMV